MDSSQAEHAVRSATDRLMSAADRLDVDGFVAMFHPDADFHNPIGMVLRGRDEIRSLHEKLYSPTPPSGFPSWATARSTGSIQAVRLLRPDIAIVDWGWTQHGARADDEEWPSRAGTNTLVWTCDNDGEWRVIAWRNKDFPPGFARPPGY
ncbi:SgcJ/EcaC family oxidoreductase [Spirillospora sp. NBC_00431]